MKTTTRFWVKYNTTARPGVPGYANTWTLAYYSSKKSRDAALGKAQNFGTEKFPASRAAAWLMKNRYEFNFEELAADFGGELSI